MVRKNDTKEVFAMKILKKNMIERRNQRIHTKSNELDIVNS